MFEASGVPDVFMGRWVYNRCDVTGWDLWDARMAYAYKLTARFVDGEKVHV